MSKMWWKDEHPEDAAATTIQRPKAPEDQPRTAEEVERVQIGLKSFKDAMAQGNQAQEEARKARAAEINRQRDEADEVNRRMAYIVAGFEPVMVNGKTMTISLARAIGAKLIPRAKPPAPKCEFSPEGGQ